MGRAGAGGYATVQHAYDTRLKRDVAIKCIKITASDIARSRISIHEAQAINASRPLSDLRRGAGAKADREGRPSDDKDATPVWDPQGGFVPLTAKISEPSFFSSREKNDERRRSRHNFLKEAKANGMAGIRASSYEAPAPPDISMDLSDFEGYSNFKGPSGRGKKSSIRGAKSFSNTRRVLSANESFTIGLSEFAGNIPGKIAGAGEADISGIGGGVNVAVASNPGQRERASRGAYMSDRNEIGYSNRNDGGANPRNRDRRDQVSPDLKRKRDAGEAQAEYASYEGTDAEDAPLDLNTLDLIPGLEEARTAAHLNDANIVTVYDCVVEDDTAYVIMEYVEGKTLAKIMRELGNDITLDMVASVFTSVSHALEVAHKAGVLHLDVKPENVIVNKEGIVKVTDFGLSTLMDASGQGVTGGGTIGYMPLEQMRQQRLDVRTDEWALASLTYEMLSGKNPFKARTLKDAEAAIEGAELVIPSLCWEQIDESVDDIMFDALSPDMDGRYPDIKSFSADLTPILGDVKAGREQLADVVKGSEPLESKRGSKEERNKKPPKPYVPFIDKLGMRGSAIVMRVFAALGAAMVAVISLMNFRFTFGQDAQVAHVAQQFAEDGAEQTFASGVSTTLGMFSIMPLAAWIVLAAVVALAAFRPRWAYPAEVIILFVMLVFNQAWFPAIMMLGAAGAWWWFFGRESDMMCTLVSLQPLFGAVGFAAVIPILAGALLDIRDAIATAGMAAVGALVFASFGSESVMDWSVMSNFIVAINPAIAGASIAVSFMGTLSSLQNWCVIATWIAAAGLYALLCRKGTHLFDILASVVAAVLVVAGILLVPLVTGDFSTLTPLTISGAAAAAILGVVFALLNIPDRVRMAPGEW